jgi:UDP-3-O-[3-hydroxymyristoyl] glucosamine N-acyltransferase
MMMCSNIPHLKELKMKLSEIAKLVNGEMRGNDIEISGVSNLDFQAEGTLGYAENKNALSIMSQSDVSALLLPQNLECDSKPVIKTENPKLAFSTVLELFSPYQTYSGKEYPNTYIAGSAKIGKNVTVMPFACVMDDAEIGDNTVIYPHVFIGNGARIGKDCVLKSGVKVDDLTVLGDRVIIHHNSVIGGDGFGYIQDDGKNHKLAQIGTIVVGNDTEIGACVTIDRATIGTTLIGEDVKIDNLVQIGHNCKIGDHTIIVSQVGIAGSSTVGKNCIFAGQVGIADHITIGDNVVILAKAGVEKKKIESNSVLLGYPARDAILTRRIFAAEEKLPELVKTIRELKEKIEHEKK